MRSKVIYRRGRSGPRDPRPSPQEQDKGARRFLVACGLDPARDVGVCTEASAAKPRGFKKTELRRLMYECFVSRQIRVLVVGSLEDLSEYDPPSKWFVADLLDRLRQAGVRVLAVREEWDSARGPAPLETSALTWSSSTPSPRAPASSGNGRRGRPPITSDKARQARALHERGWGYGSIGRELGISKTAARRACLEAGKDRRGAA